MSTVLLLDIVIAGIFLFFLIRGMQLGFVRVLCSLLALLIAFFGALFLSKALTPPVTQLLAPHILPAIIQKLEGAPTPPPEEALTPADALSLLQTIGLPESWSELLAEQSVGDAAVGATTPAQALASYLLRIILSSALYILCFSILLFLCGLLARSLDLIARLPVLNVCNRILGAAVGLCKAALTLFLLRWLLVDLFGLLPSSLLEQTYAAQLFGNLLPYLKEQRFFLF